MVTPHYVATKVGDHYVMVRQDQDGQSAVPGLVIGAITAAAVAVIGRGAVRWLAAAAAVGLAGAWFLDDQDRRGADKATPEGGASFQHDRKAAATQQPSDEVDEAMMESFPASDPPAHSISAKR